ncbi:MAG: Holliday junction branch migration protein RuvA [Acidobacteriota bacterium]|nr:Holliday junction branch migration protein RuvA [Acidobacteriota bacterium]MDH3528913.1 Holliday junction branch migration protein RuvA [Acidobacteriota bacterium]
MISFLSGKILEKASNTVILDVNGVGYEVTVPLSTYYELGEKGDPVDLRIFTYVREDTLQLFGFKTRREKALYLKLLSVQGIGAKSGIAMLSGMSADEITLAIRTDDLARLTSIPGVGKKTAERMVIELRDKLDDIGVSALPKRAQEPDGSESGNEAFGDALSALVNLGYQPKAAKKALRTAVDEGCELTVQKLLRRGLQLLAK